MSAAIGGPVDGERPHKRPGAERTDRVALLSVLMGGAALVIYSRLGGVAPAESTLGLPWWAFAAAFAASEIFVVHVEGRRGARAHSLSEVPLVVGLFTLDPAALVTARLVGSALALVLRRRQKPVKVLFNLALFSLEAGLVAMVFLEVLGGRPAIGPWAWAAAFAAMVVGTLLSSTAVSLAIALHEGPQHVRDVGEMFVTGVILSALTNTSLALVTVIVLLQDGRAAALLLVVATIVFLAYRGYSSLRQRYDGLGLLYEFTRVTGQSVEVQATVRAVLTQARELLRAERAELTLTGGSDGAVRVVLEGDGRMRRVPVVQPPGGGIRGRAMETGKGLLVSSHARDDSLREELRGEGMREAMVAPIRAESAVIGTLLVADRSGDVSTFEGDDLRLFEALCNHASITVANGRLVERLRQQAAEKEHQARHDALTGLPNRVQFQEEVARAVARAGDGRCTAVLLVDLDRFKEVNDTLGHHNGDRLLQAVSHRLVGSVHSGHTIARLGGDEFALLLTDLEGEADAERAAEALLGLLDQPFLLEGLTVEVGASVGIALHPLHAEEAASLLQRADVAMYGAKESHSGYKVYASDDDHYSPRRLSLAGELRSAMDNGDLVLHYQPKAHLGTGRIVGVEALLRWTHPQHGFVPPDEFIPIAEQTGLIRPLTLYVLRHALDQCALWQAAGWNLTMAVNLSVRSLLDEGLPADVARLLEHSGVPATSLVLEITEGSVMADPGRMTDVLNRLSALGISLSIDDFGTGYSSLGYLKRLPVSEVKIDKSFVMNMGSDENDLVIVRSTVELGHNLGLRVVAEGVEDERTWQRLVELGCDVAQGYYLSRPYPAAELERCFAVREANQRVSAPARGPHLVVVTTRTGTG